MPYWEIEGTYKNGRVCYAVEYDDAGNELRRYGPVFHQIKAIGLIARLSRGERISNSRQVGQKCEGFTRPDCLPCPSRDDVMTVAYDCMGKMEHKYFCGACRGRLLTGEPRAWY